MTYIIPEIMQTNAGFLVDGACLVTSPDPLC